MDTKLIVSEAISDFVKTNPCCRFSQIVRGVQEDHPEIIKNKVERMVKDMVADGLLVATPWQIPLGLAVRVTYRWNYAETKRIFVPAAKVAIDKSTKVTTWPVPPMAWTIHQLSVNPPPKSHRFTPARW